MIVKATFSVTVFMEAESVEAAQNVLSDADLAGILEEAATGSFISGEKFEEASEVPPEELAAELIAIGNDGDFFAHDEMEGRHETAITTRPPGGSLQDGSTAPHVSPGAGHIRP